MRFAAFIVIFACFVAISQALSLRAPEGGIVRLPKAVFPHSGKNVSSLRLANDDADDFLTVFPKVEVQMKLRKH